MKKINKNLKDVFDANEWKSNPEDPANTWSALDSNIEQAERAELEKMQASEETIEKYFEHKRKLELSKKDIKDVSWQEAHEIHDLNTPKEKHYFGKGDLPNGDKTLQDIMDQCIEVATEISMSIPEMSKVVELCKKLKSMSQSEYSDEEPVEVSKTDSRALELIRELKDEPHLHYREKLEELEKLINGEKPEEEEVSKSTICKGANGLLEGFCSVSGIIDTQGDHVDMNVIKHALPQYLRAGAPIHLNHNPNIRIGSVSSYDFRKTENGHHGLFIKVKLDGMHEQNINQAVAQGVLKGFSISGRCNFKKNCNKNKCWKDIQDLELKEISIVNVPACQEALIAS